MKPSFEQLLLQRQDLLQQMQTIDRLRRGSLSKQFFRSGDQSSAKRGPYYVLQGYFHGEKFSERIPEEQAAQVQREVENYQRFQSLAEKYVDLSDRITRRQDPLAGSKKNSSRRRSTTSDSGNPAPF